MGTWIIGTIVAALIGLAARTVYKDRKSGSCSSCCGCSGCNGGKSA